MDEERALVSEIAPVAMPAIVSDYTRTHFEGNKVVYTRHTHEGSPDGGTHGTKHKIQELGYVTYSRNGLEKPTPLPGTIVSMDV